MAAPGEPAHNPQIAVLGSEPRITMTPLNTQTKPHPIDLEIEAFLALPASEEFVRLLDLYLDSLDAPRYKIISGPNPATDAAITAYWQAVDKTMRTRGGIPKKLYFFELAEYRRLTRGT